VLQHIVPADHEDNDVRLMRFQEFGKHGFELQRGQPIDTGVDYLKVLARPPQPPLKLRRIGMSRFLLVRITSRSAVTQAKDSFLVHAASKN